MNQSNLERLTERLSFLEAERELAAAGNTLASFELHEGSASATSHFMRIDYRSGEARLAFVGAYRDVFARDTTGTWQFASRIADITS